jgi:hypothetical protein
MLKAEASYANGPKDIDIPRPKPGRNVRGLLLLGAIVALTAAIGFGPV